MRNDFGHALWCVAIFIAFFLISAGVTTLWYILTM